MNVFLNTSCVFSIFV